MINCRNEMTSGKNKKDFTKLMETSLATSKIGESWIESIKNITEDKDRYLRGLYYHNDGMVKQINICNNEIIAKVKGTNSNHYQSKFKFKKLNNETIELIKTIISENPEIAVEINEGNLSKSFFDLLDEKNASIFPQSLDEIESFCSCPDMTNPCKHMYASFIEFTKEIEKRPFIYLCLRGISAQEILSLSGVMDILEEKNKNSLINKFVETNELNFNLFNLENYDLIPDYIDINLPKTDVDKLFFPIQPHPIFYKVGEFKGLLKKIHSSITEEVDLLTKNSFRLDYKNADFYLFYDSTNTLKAFVTPTTQFLYYLRSKGSRVQFKSELQQIPVMNDGKIEFVKKEGLIVATDILFDYFLELKNDFLSEDNSLSSKFLGITKNIAISLIRSSSFQPELVLENNDKYSIRYMPVVNGDTTKNILAFYKSIMPLNILFKENTNLVMNNDSANDILSLFLTHIIHRIVLLSPIKQKNHNIINLFTKDRVIKIFSEEDRNIVRTISNWLESISLKNRFISFVIRVELHNDQKADQDSKFALYLDIINKDDPLEQIIPFSTIFEDETKSIFSTPIEQARIEIIKQIKLAANFMPVLGEILHTRGLSFPVIGLKELLELISHTTGFLNNLGIKVIVPKELKNFVSPKLSLRAKHKGNKQLGESISYMSFCDLMDFSYEIAIGDITISSDEFKKLVTSADEIVKYKDKYLLLKPEEVNSILEKIDSPPPEFSSNLELLHSALTGTYEDIEFNYDEAFRRALEEVTNIDEIDTPNGLNATLRPYQTRGFRWLYSNAQKGFGSCIADDMGLGKTIQVITLILKLKEEEKLVDPVMVICPTTLVGNWVKECKKFAPDLNIAMYHGADRKMELENTDVFITTYGLLRQDLEQFKTKDWSILVVDEAQNIKNNDTGQTIAVKSVKAKNYIAMSGTPVENRLTELWSIFDFINKGYLGQVGEFQKKYSLPIEKYRDEEKIDKLKLATAPFVLRRLKNDKSIIDDLPEKIVFDEYCYLTKEQAALYENVLESTMKTIENADGINRRGNILKLITSLKQICNHPAHFTKKDKLTRDLSGKTEKVFSILSTILDNNEKTLIFTQYKEMGELLVQMIKNELSEVPLFFHGSIPRSKRDGIIEDFQTNPESRLMIVSLKAGGTGLNLTAATNVIHYDLWWNPAVEDQATDRAYRIGQDKNVIVHRMITLGTFEEKIDEIIKSKKELANLTVSTGEKWITELSNNDLRDIFSLSNF